ncbi:MAG: polysaccharide pyruvyl transferase family protein [Rhodothermales bacterium]
MKILVTNTVLLNGGDAAILIAIVRQLRTAFGADAHIEICEARPDAAAALYPEFIVREALVNAFLMPARDGWLRRIWGVIRFAMWHLARPRAYAAARLHAGGRPRLARLLLTRRQRAAFEAYAGADLIVSTGGTYLVEHYSLAPRLFEFTIARLLRKPLVFYTQSLGPFNRPAHRKKLRAVFDDAQLVLLRDEQSLGYLRDIGVANDRVHVMPDVVFALRDPDRRPVRSDEGRPRVAVSVRSWQHFRNQSPEDGMRGYLQAVAAGVEHLVTRYDAEVVFLSTCQGVPAYRIDDSGVGRQVVDLLPASVRPRVRVDADFHRPEALLEALAGFDLVIATRMHMAILSMLAGTPVAPIVYEFKTRELMELVDYAAWAGTATTMDIDTLRGEELTKTIDTLLARLPEARRILSDRVEGIHRHTERAVDLLRALPIATE